MKVLKSKLHVKRQITNKESVNNVQQNATLLLIRAYITQISGLQTMVI